MLDRDELLRLVRGHSARAVSVLARVAGDATLSPGVQVRAAVELLRCGFGAARGERVGGDLSLLSDGELAELAELRGVDLDAVE